MKFALSKSPTPTYFIPENNRGNEFCVEVRNRPEASPPYAFQFLFFTAIQIFFRCIFAILLKVCPVTAPGMMLFALILVQFSFARKLPTSNTE